MAEIMLDGKTEEDLWRIYKKGRDTKSTIVETGLEMSSQLGLECVTIGNLAKEMQMSKSGLFAHFQSKENLQIEILEYAAEDFTEYVIRPALKVERGIPRIRNLVERCPFQCGSKNFD